MTAKEWLTGFVGVHTFMHGLAVAMNSQVVPSRATVLCWSSPQTLIDGLDIVYERQFRFALYSK